MHDECKNCVVRGEMAACEKTTCSRHETWYALQLRARVARLEEALKEIVEEYEHPTGCVIDGAEMGQIARRALEEK